MKRKFKFNSAYMARSVGLYIACQVLGVSGNGIIDPSRNLQPNFMFVCMLGDMYSNYILTGKFEYPKDFGNRVNVKPSSIE